MNLKSALLCSGALIAVAIAAQPANATTMRAVITGKLQSGGDLTGIFGLGNGADLTGLSYSLTFDYDLQRPGIVRHSYLDSAEQALYGSTSPITSASFTINGQTETFYGETGGQIQISTYPGFSVGTYNNFIQYSAMDQTREGSLVTTKLATLSYYGFFDRTPIPGNLSTSYVQALSPGIPWGQFAYAVVDTDSNSYLLKTDGLLMMDEIRVSAVPLPATLPMLGFGIAAATLMGRKRSNRVSK